MALPAQSILDDTKGVQGWSGTLRSVRPISALRRPPSSFCIFDARPFPARIKGTNSSSPAGIPARSWGRCRLRRREGLAHRADRTAQLPSAISSRVASHERPRRAGFRRIPTVACRSAKVRPRSAANVPLLSTSEHLPCRSAARTTMPSLSAAPPLSALRPSPSARHRIARGNPRAQIAGPIFCVTCDTALRRLDLRVTQPNPGAPIQTQLDASLLNRCDA